MAVYINGVPTQSAISLANGASIDQINEAIENLHYRGPHANEAAFPSTGTSGQFLFNEDTVSLWVWDESESKWVDTGVEEGGSGSNLSTQLQHVYDPVTGTGYGFADAQPGRWELTPDGRAQCIGGSYSNASAIRFARLAEPGDKVALPRMSISLSANSNQRRFTFVGVTAGQDLDHKANQGSWANGAFSQISNSPNNLEFALGWIGAYFQPYSYGPGLVMQGGGSANKAPANVTNFNLKFRVRSDYRIEVLLDGEVIALSQLVPNAGVDLYFVASYSNILPAPVGEVTTAPGGTTPPAGSTSPAYLSTVDPGVATVAEGGGYYLYEADNPVTTSDTALSSNEALVAQNLRYFQDFNGKSVSEIATLMAPVAAEDRKALDHCQNLAVGWFHAQDLTPVEIQAKMVEFGPALQAAQAGSVELTLASLQAIPLQGAGATIVENFSRQGYNSTHNYVYDSHSGPGWNAYRITYMYFRNSPALDGYGNVFRVQFASTADRDAFVSAVNTIHIEGYASLINPTIEAYPNGGLAVDFTYPEAQAIIDYTHLNGGNLNITFAEATPNDDDALVQDCIAILTTHLSKFPR
jgi:hypothetical protein